PKPDSEQFEGTLFVDNSQVAVDSISSDKASPARRAMAREELNRLKVAIAELPERTRVAVEMHRLGGFKLKQIAAHLGISISLAQLLVTEGISHCHDRLHEDEK
ncbi:MAG: sigma factor-like helix-turn-helix DNA-binding protein, partial [Verrucomicrobiota bacterium]